MGLIEKTSLPWNPQSNAILERIHQILADCLRTCELEDKEIDPTEEDPFEEELAAAAYAIRCGFHAAHGHSPGELAFGRNMFLPVEAPVDWEELKQRKQKAIAKSNQRENSKRTPHAYKAGGLPRALRKLAAPRAGLRKAAKRRSSGKEPLAPGELAQEDAAHMSGSILLSELNSMPFPRGFA